MFPGLRHGKETKKEELNNLLKDAHGREKKARKVRVKPKKRRSVVNSNVPIRGGWKANSKDKNDLTFLSINVNI